MAQKPSHNDAYCAKSRMYIPFCYMFRAPAMLMPHESTVAHEQRFTVHTPTIDSRMYIPFCYMFRAPAMLMPHESTVAHEQRFTVHTPTIDSRMHIPFCYMFRAPAMLMPHESTVAHEQRFTVDTPTIDRSRHPSAQRGLSVVSITEDVEEKAASHLVVEPAIKATTSVPHTRPETPRQLTHTHDEDCSDEEEQVKNTLVK
ncbi:unnamed protein product [Plutella xylostella]|uniref:(diamondback moth) hypothetical protein n=1 Tax=Plutella xylostella TaxID=51655 RepID=A0A8S4G0B2_PLUXY|nr:unnamed protein product [Plutella xylostella]